MSHRPYSGLAAWCPPTPAIGNSLFFARPELRYAMTAEIQTDVEFAYAYLTQCNRPTLAAWLLNLCRSFEGFLEDHLRLELRDAWKYRNHL